MLNRFAQALACAVVLGVGMVNVAEARVVVGGGIGISQFDYPDIDDGRARKFHLGWQSNDGPFFVELQSLDSGDADITGFNSVSLNVSGTTLAIGYRGETNPDTGSGFFFKGGFYDTDTEVNDPAGELCGFPCTIKDGNRGLYLGLGGDWMFGPAFGLRFDLEGLVGVEDFAEDKTVTVFTLGPVIKFGGDPQE